MQALNEYHWAQDKIDDVCNGNKKHREEAACERRLRQMVARLGGAEWVRGKIDRAKEPNALMTVLAQCGKQSTLTTEEFLTATVVQMKRLMDNMVVSEHPIQ